MARALPRPRFDRRPDGAPTYTRGARWPAWFLLAIPFMVGSAILLPIIRRRVHWVACALVVALFETVMLIVEHASLLRGHWVYNESRILGPRIWGIPIEEPLLYYLLPPILVIMIFEYIAGRVSGALPASDWRAEAARWRPPTPPRGGASYWSRRQARSRSAGRNTPMRTRSRSASRVRSILLPLVLWPGLAAMLAAGSAGAADPLPPPAVLSEVTGDVTVLRGVAKTEIDGEEDLALREGDEVKTAPGAKATISFRDEHLVRLAERSSLVIRTLKSTSTGFFGQVRLATGRLFATFAKLTGTGSGFKVETRTAVAAVKGTTFAVEDSADASTISVLEGTVSAAGLDESGQERDAVDIPEGQEADVPAQGRRPGKPRDFMVNARRAAIRDQMRELHGHAGRHRELARSGELGRGRKLRNLARAQHLLDLEQADPDAIEGQPEDRRTELREFLAEHRDELGRRGPEVRRFLDEHPEMKSRMKAQAERRLRHRQTGKPDRQRPAHLKPAPKPAPRPKPRTRDR